MSLLRALTILVATFVACAPAAIAEVFYVIDFDELTILEGEPILGETTTWRLRRGIRERPPYAVFEGRGEAYLDYRETERADGNEVIVPRMAIRVPSARRVEGRLFVPDAAGSAMREVSFTIPESTEPADAESFYRAMEGHYRRLVAADRPGAAWFRYQAGRAARLATASASPDEEQSEDEDASEGAVALQRGRAVRQGEVQETYELVTGGRALAENLQLDRNLAVEPEGKAEVDIDSITGITVREFDWEELTKDLKPELDALSNRIPEDQHAVFFSSFAAMVKMLDEAAANGMPILHLFDARAEDAHTRERYERQLGLELTDAARLFGSAVIAEIAMTGSDPYLRLGSDVAVLFRTRGDAKLLTDYLRAQHAIVVQSNGSSVESSSGDVAGVSYFAVVAADRSVSSYVARLDSDVIVVTNSRVQLERLAKCGAGEMKPLSKSLEYKFLRDRYALGEVDESAFAILTDATIRRWCSPRWRIASSRRIRAAAALSELRASAIDPASEGIVVSSDMLSGVNSEIVIGSDGARSTRYGTLEFMTPVAEIPIRKVTQREADAYTNWRRGYENNWRFFDPIAIRFGIREDRLAADVTAIPLIVGTRYREFMRVVRGGELEPEAGDRHAEALYQIVIAVDLEAQMFRSAEGFASMMTPGVKSPLSWLGGSASFYIDDDPLWDELAKSDDPEDFVEENLDSLPFGLQVAVRSPLKLAAFLAGLRGFIQQSAPNLLVWETLEHEGTTFVKISAEEDADLGNLEELSLYYVSLPDMLTFGLREDLVRRAIDRHKMRAAAKKAGRQASGDAVAAGAAGADSEVADAGAVDSAEPGADAVRLGEQLPLLGKSVAMQIRKRAVDVLHRTFERNMRYRLQRRSWSALPILNEWRMRFGAKEGFDAIAFHQRSWGVELLCPGGGEYVWNEKWQTMESTVFGHPGDPQEGPVIPPAIRAFTRGNFGLTFEHDGVRARAELDR